MYEYERNQAYTADAGSLNAYMTKVFLNMAVGLGLTALVAFLGYYSVMTGGIFYTILVSMPMLGIILLLAQLGIAIALGHGITKYSVGTCRGLFLGYSAMTGITFTTLALSYGIGTVFTAFLFAAVLFACCAVIGKYTNVDLSRFSGLFRGALIALLITTVISLFVPALRASLFMSYAGLLIFLGLTAYDMQKITHFYYSSGGTLRENLAIYAAFELYLDFINILIYLVRILGSRNSRR